MNKRKVTWKEPVLTDEELEYYEKKGEVVKHEEKEVTGFLHYWGHSAYWNEEFNVMLTETYCYVEEENTGEIVKLHPEDVTFVKD